MSSSTLRNQKKKKKISQCRREREREGEDNEAEARREQASERTTARAWKRDRRAPTACSSFDTKRGTEPPPHAHSPRHRSPPPCQPGVPPGPCTPPANPAICLPFIMLSFSFRIRPHPVLDPGKVLQFGKRSHRLVSHQMKIFSWEPIFFLFSLFRVVFDVPAQGRLSRLRRPLTPIMHALKWHLLKSVSLATCKLNGSADI